MGGLYDSTWGRAFTAFYDRMIQATEDAGLRETRRRALAVARGRTVDVGAGTGANLDLYPRSVTELVLAEPDPHMLRRLRPKAAGAGAEVVAAPAERLPFDDASVDTIAFTLVLCTVPDPEAALAEAARVLRPGGRLLFVEHVRSRHDGLARWQDRLEKPWRFFADGCHCNRNTVATIEASPLTLESVEHEEMPKSPPLVRPLVWGSAALPD